jgi:ribosomal protein S18 acetylase RimI-like enzyme
MQSQRRSVKPVKKTPVIRKATPVDADSIQQCVAAAYQHYVARIGKPPGPMLDDYGEIIRRHSVFVAEVDEIVGVLVLMRTQTGILLDNVAVHPGQQGAGLGKRLIELAENEARNQGFAKLDLYTHECMRENIEIYRALGYLETERKQERGYHRVYLQKALSR